MIKYFLSLILIIACITVACKKTNNINSGVLFYNATWSLPSFTVSWNEGSPVTTAITPGISSGTADSPYVQAPAGTNLITLKSGSATLLSKNIYTTAATGNSFFLYDTSATISAVGILQLTDDLTQPDTATINYRIIDLSPDPNATADIWLVHGATDSIRLDSAYTFIGQNPAAASYAAFTPLKYHGEQYTIKFKKTGTEQVLASVVNYPFAVRNIYTIVFSGLINGNSTTKLKLSVLHHRSP